MKTALITGVSGQDGSYLAELLIQKNYNVIGIIRIGSDCSNLNYLKIESKLTIVSCNLLSIDSVSELLEKYKPQEVYHLAAQSSVGNSFKKPVETVVFNTISTLNLLEAIRVSETLKNSIKFYHASSSEMYGKVEKLPVTESSAIYPLSPYGVSKAASHWSTINYRESFGLFACCGILFNHESFLRKPNFFIKKVIKESIEIEKGVREFLYVGNLEVYRDFGYSPKYVEAMWLMVQQEKPEDYIICSGKSISLRQVVEYVFEKLNICLKKCKIDESLYRPVELENIYGDNSKAVKKLKWSYELDFFQVIDVLMNEELDNYSN